MKVLDSNSNYLKQCKVVLDNEKSVYGTAFRGTRASKPFMVYYKGDDNIDKYIMDTCTLHYHFGNVKLPMPIMNADKNAWWLHKHGITSFDKQL